MVIFYIVSFWRITENEWHEKISSMICRMLFSLCMETMQYILMIRYSDSTDVITNTLGTIVFILFLVFFAIILSVNM